MSQPYPKYDSILRRDLSAAERLDKQQAFLRQSIRFLQQGLERVGNAADSLTEEELSIICSAVDSAYNAASNIAFLGMADYLPRPVKTVEWKTENAE